ncbi:unnamed protein product, partial [Oppiella nova]
DWTDLNPSAPTFIPRAPHNTSQDTAGPHRHTTYEEEAPTVRSSASTSGANDKKVIRNKKSSTDWKSTSGKPSVLTLQQFITEKLKIDDKSPKPSQKTSSTHPKKVQTHETPHNTLDSSAPTRKRGKERENPKAKKPTTLKRIINKERDGLVETQDSSLRSCDGSHDLETINKKLLHTKAYREYCCQRLTQSIDQLVVNLLSDLVLFQDRMFSKDPIKAKTRKRLTFGFNEVTKYANINKIKLLVIAPDIEKIESRGGLDDSLSALISITQNNGIPIVFALNRYKLGRICKKKGYVSCVGVLNYDGSQDNFKQLLSLCETERNEYNSVFEESLNKLKALSDQQIDEILNDFPKIPKEFCQTRDDLNPSDRQLVKCKKSSQ